MRGKCRAEGCGEEVGGGDGAGVGELGSGGHGAGKVLRGAGENVNGRGRAREQDEAESMVGPRSRVRERYDGRAAARPSGPRYRERRAEAAAGRNGPCATCGRGATGRGGAMAAGKGWGGGVGGGAEHVVGPRSRSACWRSGGRGVGGWHGRCGRDRPQCVGEVRVGRRRREAGSGEPGGRHSSVARRWCLPEKRASCAARGSSAPCRRSSGP